MAASAATAWQWSAVDTVTASSFSLSSISRKSLYFRAPEKRSKVRAAFFQSTSHRATTFSEAQPPMSEAPLPPAPMAPMLSFSLGDLYPARTRLGGLAGLDVAQPARAAPPA